LAQLLIGLGEGSAYGRRAGRQFDEGLPDDAEVGPEQFLRVL
jgi:hypothetical protein